MFDFQVEKSLPTHENYYVNLNDYFIAYTYIFNVLLGFFFFLYSFSFSVGFAAAFVCHLSAVRQPIYSPLPPSNVLYSLERPLMETPLVLQGHYLLW